ncbi:universal stress protein [Streptomyces panaciradicis]|uniref:universal stress protein n=1 Tax=Streptomyces panaciradicis TaxID=1470261 RepID=UPI00201D0855|nr:universal stress protein [Streptomyces panaciradicis]MCL6674959.1 universal stress protein [Streptomyces panaciradicis]
MSRPVIAGIDGSATSLAAASWAAREAVLRDAPLHLLAAWSCEEGTPPDSPEAAASRLWAVHSLDLALDRLRGKHPRLPLHAQLLNTSAHEALLTAGADAQLLVLGSRGLSGTSALLLGSTGAQTAAQADFPLTLVRPLPHPADLPQGPVLLALDAGHHAPPDDVIAFAFEEAAIRRASLRALYAWLPAGLLPTYPVRRHGHSPQARQAENRLTEALHPWRQKFPSVRVEEMCVEDVPAGAVSATARHAALAVLGHRLRPGGKPRLGAVAHATLRHAPCPVPLIPHT